MCGHGQFRLLQGAQCHGELFLSGRRHLLEINLHSSGQITCADRAWDFNHEALEIQKHVSLGAYRQNCGRLQVHTCFTNFSNMAVDGMAVARSTD